MARPEKERIVHELVEKLSRSNVVILTDYRGLKVSDLNELRKRLRTAGVEYQVAKNTLTRIAARQLGRTAIERDLEGPTALALGYQDPVDAAKALSEYMRTSRLLSVKAALLGDRRLSAEEVTRLAELPPREQLRAEVVGALQGPLAALVGVLNGLLTNVVYAIDQRVQQRQPASA